MAPSSSLQVRRRSRFVSRGGEKLQGALESFCLSVQDRICVDLGTSTGGFVDCLLQSGARRVYAFDVGRGQIAWRLATDPRLVLRDRYNVRHLRPADLPERFFLMTVDLSFISLRLILAPIAAVVRERGEPDAAVLLLVKPQFELPRDRIGPGGVVADPAEGEKEAQKIADLAVSEGLVDPKVFASPLKGAEGNQEYFLMLRSAG